MYDHYINGEWVNGQGSGSFLSKNPATGETLGEFSRATSEDVSQALSAADESFEE